ncbi:MAG TPA: gfo/Idh/MocA family oxidoreductase [Thermoplasmata archaeon]|nr:MAG TPA: gfo/Idh/MocA family oxidoreductase [Thermoplasmata archaeon]
MKVGIIGCGAIGRKRALSLGDHELVIAVDTSLERANEVAKLKNCSTISTNYDDALNNDEIDLILISTTNEILAKITLAAVTAGKHVLVEKPAGRTPEELIPIIETAEENNVFVKVGFNHRYHPALLKAKQLVDSGGIGPLMFIRGRYGHGGRLGYEKEWRAIPEKSGGGELIDQGVHLIDLSRWFLGELSVVKGFAHTYYWDMPVDDNAFLMLKNANNKIAWLHVSCTEWKNMFSFEIYGETGKLHIDGLGGSYGVERLFLYKMLPTMGPPETTMWEYPFADNSWNLELDEFIRYIELQREPEGNICDAKKALDIVKIIYDECNYRVNV